MFVSDIANLYTGFSDKNYESEPISLSTEEYMKVFQNIPLDPFDAYNQIEANYKQAESEIDIAETNGLSNDDVSVYRAENKQQLMDAKSSINTMNQRLENANNVLEEEEIVQDAKEKLHILHASSNAFLATFEKANGLFSSIGTSAYLWLNKEQFINARLSAYHSYERLLKKAKNYNVKYKNYVDKLMQSKAKKLKEINQKRREKGLDELKEIPLSNKEQKRLEKYKNRLLNYRTKALKNQFTLTSMFEYEEYLKKQTKRFLLLARGKEIAVEQNMSYKEFCHKKYPDVIKQKDKSTYYVKIDKYRPVDNRYYHKTQWEFMKDLLSPDEFYELDKKHSDEFVPVNPNKEDTVTNINNPVLTDDDIDFEEAFDHSPNNVMENNGIPLILPDSSLMTFKDVDRDLYPWIDSKFLTEMGFTDQTKAKALEFCKKYSLAHMSAEDIFASVIGFDVYSQDTLAELLNRGIRGEALQALCRAQNAYRHLNLKDFISPNMTGEHILYMADSFSRIPPRVVDVDKMLNLTIAQYQSLCSMASHPEMFNEAQLEFAIDEYSKDKTATHEFVTWQMGMAALREKTDNEVTASLDNAIKTYDSNPELRFRDFSEEMTEKIMDSPEFYHYLKKNKDINSTNIESKIIEAVNDDPAFFADLPLIYHNNSEFVTACYKTNPDIIDYVYNEDFIQKMAPLIEQTPDESFDEYQQAQGFASLEEAASFAKRASKEHNIENLIQIIKTTPKDSMFEFSCDEEMITVSCDNKGYLKINRYNHDTGEYDKITENVLKEILSTNPKGFAKAIKNLKEDITLGDVTL